MKQVVVHPERCVGCLQCMLACATAHSRSRTLPEAVLESPRPRPRVHVGVGCFDEGFPNRCRHCDPAPCMLACLPGAIYRDAQTNTVLIDTDRCINCASCAMVCPFGVLRYHPDVLAPPDKTVAVKCDNCIARQQKGQIPACVEACRTGALTFEPLDGAMRRKTDAVSRTVSAGRREVPPPAGYALLTTIKHEQVRLRSH
ncbi:MAG: 4Fe-4S dicluster domain-containing protein [Desulfatitalea sp.]|nr:4Fe-4S dicluster domain-containing protein [Desulfatitalea sp.]